MPPVVALAQAGMGSRIVLINGHPDPRPQRLCSALASAYAEGAAAAGRQIRRIDVGALEAPMIRTAEEFMSPPSAPFVDAQQAIRWADHLVIIHPLWLGGAPAVLKAFLEQVFRYGFAIPKADGGGRLGGLLKGRSARMVVTMGMPAPVYRLAFGAFGTRAVERGILWLSGMHPIRRTLIGGVEQADAATKARWLVAMRRLGEKGA